MSDTPIIRVSERTTYKRCMQKWEWSWRYGLNGKSTQPQLWFGTGVHLAFANWYCGPGTKRGPHPAETWEAYAGEYERWAKTQAVLPDEETEAKFIDLKTLGTVLMDEYVKFYGRDEHMHVISPEKTWALDIPWPAESPLIKPDREWLARHVGTFDLVWRHVDTGQLWLEEHKTAASIYLGHLALDDQGGTYWTMAYRTLLAEGLIKKGDRLRGIEYNFVRKALPDTRPKDAEGYYCNRPTKPSYLAALEGAGWGLTPKEARGMKLDDLAAMAARHGLTVLGERSKVQTGPLFVREPVHRTAAERVTQLQRIQDEALVIEVSRRGLLPITKTPARECRRFCDFYEMCELHEHGGNFQDFMDLAFHQDDPYAAHRSAKSTEE